MTAVPKVRFLVCGTKPARNISGDGNGSVIAEKCSPIHNSSKPRRSASTDFSVSSRSVSDIERPGGCTGIMNRPSLMSELRLFRRLGLSLNVLPESRHDLLGEESHGFALPFLVFAAPVEPGLQQATERTDRFAERDQLVE